MGLSDQLKGFLKKQFIDVIHWTEPEEGILAWRFPMQDMEIQNGAKLTVRESQMALFVNEGRAADAFGPGLYTLNTQTLPLLTNLMNWDKLFQSPFKSDVYFFSTRQQLAQRWGTAQPVTIRDKDFGAIRLRGYGIYSWHIADPRAFHQKVSGTRELYRVGEMESQLRNTIVQHISDGFAESGIPFLDMAANLVEVGFRIKQALTPIFAEMGISLDTLVVENLSLPDELQKKLDERISMNIIGDIAGRDCILIDDIVDSAGTLCNAAVALKEAGASSVSAYVTHGVLSGGAVARVSASPMDSLVITDSIMATEAVRVSQTVRQITIAPLLAEAIQRISGEQSVSSLFN